MPIKYVPFIPEPVEGQAVLGNFRVPDGGHSDTHRQTALAH